MEKTCSKCRNAKSLSDFNKKKSNKDGHQSCCRSCQSESMKQHYRDNPERLKVIGDRSRDNVRSNSVWLYNYLAANPCVDCGEDNPVVLEFDHRNRDEKIKSVSHMTTHSRESVMAEVAKCDVRCVNCHRLRTAKQLGWYQWEGHPLNGKL
jgi:hypothetical protein